MKRFVSVAAVVGLGVSLANASPPLEDQPGHLICAMSADGFVCKATDEEVAHLLCELRDGDDSIRKQAAKRLGSLELHCHPEIEPALANVLVTDCSKHVRLAAAHALVKLGAALPCTADAYRHALGDSCLLVRAYAKSALNHTPGFGPVPGPGLVGTGYRGHSTRLKPFVLGDTRYEPTVRDTRFIPQITTLPGADSGIRETLPVTPPRRHGYFMLPNY